MTLTSQVLFAKNSAHSLGKCPNTFIVLVQTIFEDAHRDNLMMAVVIHYT